MITKICAVCMESKLFENFGRNSLAKDGLQTVCKICRKNKDAKSVLRVVAVQNRARATDKKCISCQKVKALVEFNLRTNSTDGRESRCRLCYREMKRQRNSLNPPYKANPERHKAAWHNYNSKKKLSSGVITADVIEAIFLAYGKKCLACGSRDNIAIDHVVPITQGGSNLIDNLQPLCRSCNSSKGNRSSADYRTYVFDFAFEENGVNIYL